MKKSKQDKKPGASRKEKKKNGEKKLGILRSTFIVDGAGTVRHALYDVKPKGHAEQIMELVRAL